MQACKHFITKLLGMIYYIYYISNFHHIDFKMQKIIDLSLAERFRGLPVTPTGYTLVNCGTTEELQ